jgi:signal transduction histidine kinase
MKRKFLKLSKQYRYGAAGALKQGRQAPVWIRRADWAAGAGRRIANAGPRQAPRADPGHGSFAGCPANVPRSSSRRGFFCRGDHAHRETHRSARDATDRLKKFIETLSQRTVELAAANLELSLEIGQRKVAEAALQKSERHYSQLLKQSDLMQEQLRRLSRQILSAQEDERRRISRELHDVIAQTLTGINIRLATLKKEAAVNTKGLDRNIARTQRLVEKSVNIVHEFARELRPAVLDDLGLIPALHSFVKLFSQAHAHSCSFESLCGVEKLNSNQRTILYRVAQEALNNVSRHAQASRVEVSIRETAGGRLHENKRTTANRLTWNASLQAKGRKRLGLLGMRERVEMVGGTFCVESAPGKGTTIVVEIPVHQSAG